MIAKYSSILLAIFVLAQSFNLHSEDLLKLGTLVSHIEFHQDEYGDDLFAFISKHYGDKRSSHDEEPKDSEDHHRLPFNHNRCLDSGQIFVMNIDNPSFHLLADDLIQTSHFYYQNSYTFIENSDVFQPPKIT